MPSARLLKLSARFAGAAICAALLSPLLQILPAQQFPSDSAITARVRSIVETTALVGVVVGILEADGTRRFVAHGTPGPDAPPLDSRSLFEIGSVNKTFTSALLAEMVQRGEVHLDDPVAKFLPAGTRLPARGERQITLLDLATHHSALPRVADHTPANPANPYADVTADALYRFLATHELRRDIGAQYEYSNLGFGLLGHALGRAGASDYHTLLRERVITPLGLQSTTPQPTGELASRVVKGHNPEGQVVSQWDAPDAIAGAGGLRSSAEDMLTWIAAHIDPPRMPLQRALRETHVKRADQNAQLGVGLAWTLLTVRGNQVVSHTGRTGGFGTFVGFIPERRVGIVVLTNSSAAENALLQLALELLAPLPAAIAVDAALLAQYVGSYDFGNQRALTFTLQDGVLHGQMTGQATFPMVAETPSLLWVGRMGGPASVRFERDASGQFQAVLIQGGVERTAKRVP